MNEKVFLRLFSVGLERSLEYSLEAGGSCGFSWCLGHDNNAYEIVRMMGDVVDEDCEHWAKGVHRLMYSRFPKPSASANDNRRPCPAGRKGLTQPEVEGRQHKQMSETGPAINGNETRQRLQ